MDIDKIRVGITHGDINGVGYEIVLKAFAHSPSKGEEGLSDMCIPILFGSQKVAAYYRKLLDIDANFVVTPSAAEAVGGRLNLVPCFDDEVKMDPGLATDEGGRAAYLSIEKAMESYRKGEIDVLVTCPINKKNILGDDFPFIGHTDYLEHETGGDAEALMILMNDVMKVALVTTHVAVKDVAQNLSKEKIERKIELFHHSLRDDFTISIPRIAVLSLNPHCGDEGVIGSEEQELIIPAIEAMRDKGYQCFGPYAADGFFGAGLYKHFDGVLAMYHDQGLAPFKALSMNDGINYTAGLPIVRTSPDHGVAYDIAGKGKADENSFRQAIYTAIDIWRNRKILKEVSAHPLKIVSPERDSKSYSQRNNHPDIE